MIPVRDGLFPTRCIDGLETRDGGCRQVVDRSIALTKRSTIASGKRRANFGNDTERNLFRCLGSQVEADRSMQPIELHHLKLVEATFEAIDAEYRPGITSTFAGAVSRQNG